MTPHSLSFGILASVFALHILNFSLSPSQLPSYHAFLHAQYLKLFLFDFVIQELFLLFCLQSLKQKLLFLHRFSQTSRFYRSFRHLERMFDVWTSRRVQPHVQIP